MELIDRPLAERAVCRGHDYGRLLLEVPSARSVVWVDWPWLASFGAPVLD